MAPKNAIYAQSGGVTAVINATACGVLEKARKHPDTIDKVYAGRNGITGVLQEDLLDTSYETDHTIASLIHSPGGAFGSCRYKLKDLETNKAEYERLIEVFHAHNVGYFFYNGGGDSQDTAHKVSLIGEKLGYPITCIGIPKTVDNDLALTDSCPGFGSVAKYTAISTREAGLDVASMSETSTKVFIMEVMGRHAGWIAAASGLAKEEAGDPPHVILFPEIPFDHQGFLERVQEAVENHGYCVVVVSEGASYGDGTLLSASNMKDAFGHTQLGGVAPLIAAMVKEHLGYKYHWAVADYLQRAARHIASGTDVQQAYAMGEAAVQFALEGKSAVLPIIVREPGEPYRWHVGEARVEDVANREASMPRDYITEDGFGITDKARQYLEPLIQGENPPPYKDGLPQFARLRGVAVPKLLNRPFQLTK